MKYRKGKDKYRRAKIKKKQKKVERKVISVIKIGICVLILNGELCRVPLEILLRDVCTFGICYIVSSLVKLCQNS